MSIRLCIVLERIVIVFGAFLLEIALLKRKVNTTLYFYLYFLLQVVSELFFGHEVGEFLGTKWENFFYFHRFLWKKRGRECLDRFLKLYV
jgi:hypothetical protein